MPGDAQVSAPALHETCHCGYVSRSFKPQSMLVPLQASPGCVRQAAFLAKFAILRQHVALARRVVFLPGSQFAGNGNSILTGR